MKIFGIVKRIEIKGREKNSFDKFFCHWILFSIILIKFFCFSVSSVADGINSLREQHEDNRYN